MQMHQKLMQETPTQPPLHHEYFIDRYNDVVDTYNSSTTNNGIQLQHLERSQIFVKINRIMSKTLVKILMVLLLAFVPGVNLVILGFLVFYYLFLRTQGKKHKNNLLWVKNPMESYHFLPQICQQLGKHCTTLQIKTKDLQGFTFNPNLHRQLKQRCKHSDTITVTIYDQYFYDSYHLFRKEQYKVSAWVLLAVLLIAADAVLYVALFDLY